MGLVPAASADDRRPERVAELGSQLLPLRGGDDARISAARKSDLSVSRAGRVLVQAYVNGAAGQAAAPLREAGMSIQAIAEDPLPVVEGWIRVERLGPLARLGLTRAVLPVTGGGADAGSVQSEGVASHRLPQAFASGAARGEGVDVGIISDSIDRVGGGVSASQATGDLPAAVSVLKDDPGPGTVDEGRAMAEIVYDAVPGIDSVLFASGTAGGPAGKADSIDRLVEAGADVIADDIFWLSEPYFLDGVVAQSVNRARASGVTYLASSGNRARQSWEGTYADSSGLHDFDPGAGVDRVQAVATVPDGGFLQLAIQWDEVWGQARSDFDVKLFKADGSPLPCGAPGGGTDDNPATGFPAETVTWANDCAAGNVDVGLSIERFSGSESPFMKYIARGNFGTFEIAEYATGSGTVNPDAASAAGSLAVAAVDALDPGLDTPEPYNSRGPVTKLFDSNRVRLAVAEVRQKPELAAADGLSTTVPGFASFFGTSAAVPAAAGVAAMLKSSNPAATAGEIRRVMTDPANAIDCTESDSIPDPDCGAGFVLADRAFAALDRTGPIVSPALAPARPNGRRGWYTRAVRLEWSVSDPDSPLATQRCPSVTVSADGVRSFTCEATSGGGTTLSSVRVRLDTAKPRKPKIRGLRSRAYRLSGRNRLPAKRRLRCRSGDRTSGLASCRITGYSRKPGRHRLVARAIDRAGLSSVSRLRYRVR